MGTCAFALFCLACDGGSPSQSASSTEGAGGLEDGNNPYAHVVAVSATGEEGSYTFSVSIESSDIDCSQFANWWEVLSEEGELLFRRILQHSHTDENGTTDPDAPGNTFTRTGGPVDVDFDEVVLVRAHMSTGGYRGDVLRGSVSTGFSLASDLADDFALDVEFEQPQPTTCSY